MSGLLLFAPPASGRVMQHQRGNRQQVVEMDAPSGALGKGEEVELVVVKEKEEEERRRPMSLPCGCTRWTMASALAAAASMKTMCTPACDEDSKEVVSPESRSAS